MENENLKNLNFAEKHDLMSKFEKGEEILGSPQRTKSFYSRSKGRNYGDQRPDPLTLSQPISLNLLEEAMKKKDNKETSEQEINEPNFEKTEKESDLQEEEVFSKNLEEEEPKEYSIENCIMFNKSRKSSEHSRLSNAHNNEEEEEIMAPDDHQEISMEEERETSKLQENDIASKKGSSLKHAERSLSPTISHNSLSHIPTDPDLTQNIYTKIIEKLAHEFNNFKFQPTHPQHLQNPQKKPKISHFAHLKIPQTNEPEPSRTNFGLYTEVNDSMNDSKNDQEPLENEHFISREEATPEIKNDFNRMKRNSVDIPRGELEANHLKFHNRAMTKMRKREEIRPFDLEQINVERQWEEGGINAVRDFELSPDNKNILLKIKANPSEENSIENKNEGDGNKRFFGDNGDFNDSGCKIKGLYFEENKDGRLGEAASGFIKKLQEMLIEEVKGRLLAANKDAMNNLNNLKIIYSEKFGDLETIYTQSKFFLLFFGVILRFLRNL